MTFWLQHPDQACFLTSLPCHSHIPSKTNLSYLMKDWKAKPLKRTSQCVHNYWTLSYLQLLPLLPFSDAYDPTFHVWHKDQRLLLTKSLHLSIVWGTQHGLNSSKTINEVRTVLTVLTCWLLSNIQTRVPPETDFSGTSTSQKDICQCKQRKATAKLVLIQLPLAKPWVLCRQNVRIQQK